MTTRPYVRQLLQHESEKLSRSCILPTKPVTGDPGQMNVDAESSCTNAVAAAIETSAQNLDVTKADSATVTNPCIAVTRSAAQRYYKEITTYGEMAF